MSPVSSLDDQVSCKTRYPRAPTSQETSLEEGHSPALASNRKEACTRVGASGMQSPKVLPDVGSLTLKGIVVVPCCWLRVGADNLEMPERKRAGRRKGRRESV
jgi:hypothetical protein